VVPDSLRRLKQKRAAAPGACAEDEDYRLLVARGSGPPRCSSRMDAIRIATEPPRVPSAPLRREVDNLRAFSVAVRSRSTSAVFFRQLLNLRPLHTRAKAEPSRQKQTRYKTFHIDV